jgi:predicted site-specific integrase-resolvase
VNGLPEMMTAVEVGDLFRVEPKTVGRWAKAGKLRSVRTPGEKTGHGHLRFYRAQVRALAAGKPLTEAELDALVRGETW